MGALGVVAAMTSFVFQWRSERRLEELEAQVAAIQAAEEHDARAIADLQGSRFVGPDPDDAEERAALEAQLREAAKKNPADVPRCRCAGNGDPLCAEIPGQTCVQ